MTNYQIVRALVAQRLRTMIPDTEAFEAYVGRQLTEAEADVLCTMFARYTDDLAAKVAPKTRRKE